MATLAKELRRELARTVTAARGVAEEGAWNDLHYTRDFKKTASKRAAATRIGSLPAMAEEVV